MGPQAERQDLAAWRRKRKGGFKGVIHYSCPSPRICGHYLSAVLRHFTSILMLTPEGTFSP